MPAYKCILPDATGPPNVSRRIIVASARHAATSGYQAQTTGAGHGLAALARRRDHLQACLGSAEAELSRTRGRVAVKTALVICTHNRASLLCEALQSVAASPAPRRLELVTVVVANACTDDTIARVAALARTFPYEMQTFEIPMKGKAHALNQALQRIDADAFAFMDDDQELSDGYFSALETGLCDRTEPLLCGRILPAWTGAEPAWVHDPSPYAVRPLPIPIQEWGPEERLIRPDERVPGGGNLVARREAIQTIGPFRDDLGPRGHNLGGGEDIEWVRRGLARGVALRYLPDLMQRHAVDLSRLRLPYLMRKAYVRSRTSERLSTAAPSRVPSYMWRKLADNLWHAGTALYVPHIRHYLVRVAATLGEIAAHRSKRTPTP